MTTRILDQVMNERASASTTDSPAHSIGEHTTGERLPAVNARSKLNEFIRSLPRPDDQYRPNDWEIQRGGGGDFVILLVAAIIIAICAIFLDKLH